MPRTSLSLSVTVFMFVASLVTGDPNTVLGGLATGLVVTLLAYRKDRVEQRFYDALCRAAFARKR